MTPRAIGLTLCAILLTLGWPSSLFAQSQFKERTVGDWLVYESLGHTGDDPPKGIPNMAETRALDGRKAKLGIEACERYSVYFRIGGSDLDSAIKDIPDISFQRKIVFGKVDHDGEVVPMILTGGDEEYFQANIGALVRGAGFMICPTQDDKNPACLNFSLRGISTALKMICPKR
jgi:hypothetical protein